VERCEGKGMPVLWSNIVVRWKGVRGKACLYYGPTRLSGRKVCAKKACLMHNYQIPIDQLFLCVVGKFYGTRDQIGSFILINVGSGFLCLRDVSLFLFLHTQNDFHLLFFIHFHT